MLADFDKACGKIGLRLNLKKTIFMKNELVSFAPFTLNGTNICECCSCVYLSRKINMMNDLAPELSRRKRVAWGAFKSIEDVMKRTKNTGLRAHLFDSAVLRALTYASETWSLRKEDERALSVIEHAVERTMLGVSRFTQDSVWRHVHLLRALSQTKHSIQSNTVSWMVVSDWMVVLQFQAELENAKLEKKRKSTPKTPSVHYGCLPQSLREILERDHDAVIQRRLLAKLPALYPIDVILHEFLTNFQVDVTKREDKIIVSFEDDISSNRISDLVRSCQMITDYFNLLLGSCLSSLAFKSYPFCPLSHINLVRSAVLPDNSIPVRLSSIYGFPHLLRLFDCLREKFQGISTNTGPLLALKFMTSDFVEFVDGNREKYFSVARQPTQPGISDGVCSQELIRVDTIELSTYLLSCKVVKANIWIIDEE
uniref:MRG domain-containing protein n=1 Tax=Angiostrongylus cantonensis TaxID=6313 RepID=A0A158PB20_ANGCA